jgi:hypothetical protein
MNGRSRTSVPVKRDTCIAQKGTGTLKEADEKMWGAISATKAIPGDIAWVGPCEHGVRIVCYYDEDMKPTDCRMAPC